MTIVLSAMLYLVGVVALPLLLFGLALLSDRLVMAVAAGGPGGHGHRVRHPRSAKAAT